MKFIQGQLITILAPFMDYEVYANVSQINDDSILLEMKTNTDIPFNKDILCIVVEEDNIFEFYTQVITKERNSILVRKPEVNEYSVIEKRKFNRVDCNIGFVATPISINNIPIPNSDKKFTGMIKNISAGGVLVESNLKLPEEMVFAFKLKLNFFLDCKARIIRTLPVENDTIYQSGCQFVDNNIDNIKTISFYAFKEKLAEKRKELNLNKLR